MEKTSKQFVTVAMMVLAGAIVGHSDIVHASLEKVPANNTIDTSAEVLEEVSVSAEESHAKSNEATEQPISQTAPTTESAPYSVHTVLAGESLYSIATRYNTTIDNIKKANALTSNFIYPGQELMVPHTQSTPVATSTVTSATTPTVFATLSQAVTYAKANFDYTKHHNWYVDYKPSGYVVRLEEKQSVVSTNVTPLTNKPTAPAVKPTTPSQSSQQVYTVVAGDYLYRIATKYGTTVDALKKANNLTSNFIQIGDKLVIPTKQVVSTQPTAPVVTPTVKPTILTADLLTFKTLNDAIRYAKENFDATKHDNWYVNYKENGYVVRLAPKVVATSTQRPSTKTRYTVKSGDSLWAIARRFGTTIQQIKAMNNLSNNMIHPGDQLVVG